MEKNYDVAKKEWFDELEDLAEELCLDRTFGYTLDWLPKEYHAEYKQLYRDVLEWCLDCHRADCEHFSQAGSNGQGDTALTRHFEKIDVPQE
jgi:hypothetical protein